VIRSLALVAAVAVLSGCPRQPAAGPTSPPPPATADGTLPRWLGGYRLPVEGRWRVYRTHYGAKRDQAFAVDLVKDEEWPREPSPLDDYPSYREPIVADGPGVVVEAVDGLPEPPIGVRDEKRPYGNHVVIDHGNGEYSLFAHLIPGSLRVQKGQVVGMGQLLGLCGNSGRSWMPHLHWQIMNHADKRKAIGVPPRHVPYEKNGETSTELLQKGDIVAPSPP
jgi:murein DD-endopeptidase MepM/ murein hydrolase activator NlpD